MFNANETVRDRISNDELFVISCNGCVAIVRNAAGEIYPIAVGYLYRPAR